MELSFLSKIEIGIFLKDNLLLIILVLIPLGHQIFMLTNIFQEFQYFQLLDPQYEHFLRS